MLINVIWKYDTILLVIGSFILWILSRQEDIKMNKRIIATLILTLSLSTNVVYADYVDNSNRAHADHQNIIIEQAFISHGNSVVIYLENETGISYDLGKELSNYNIPFVKIKSVEVEKLKLSENKKNEIDSEYYNKITLKTTSSIHENQRFVIISEFEDGSNDPQITENLMHSIAPKGEIKTPIYMSTESESGTQSDEKDIIPATVLVEVKNVESKEISYDHIVSCISLDSEHIRIDFSEDIQLEKTKAEDYRSYNLISTSGEKLYVLKAAMIQSNQLILQTQEQTTNERYTLQADWIVEDKIESGYFYSNTEIK